MYISTRLLRATFYVAIVLAPAPTLADTGMKKSCLDEVQSTRSGFCMTVVSGAISKADLNFFQKTNDPKDFRFIELDSEGGDVESAIAIARLLRQKRGYRAHVLEGQKCFSACVLLLAGASHRTVVGSVGIHRPYADNAGADRSVDQIAAEQARLAAFVKQFLSEVRVNPSLYDDMMGTPPQKIRILSKLDLERYGLSGNDPAVEQGENERIARSLGISMQEYLKRKARMDQCKDRDCQSASLYGISVSELMLRRKRAKAICSGKPNQYECEGDVIERGK